MFVTGLAQIPYTALQSTGRASTTARLHLLELPFFIAAMTWAASRWGIEGAAWAWLARVVVDALLLCWATQRGTRLVDGPTLRFAAVSLLGFLGLLLPDATVRAGWWLVVSGLCLAGAARGFLQRSRTMRDPESP